MQMGHGITPGTAGCSALLALLRTRHAHSPQTLRQKKGQSLWIRDADERLVLASAEVEDPALAR